MKKTISLVTWNYTSAEKQVEKTIFATFDTDFAIDCAYSFSEALETYSVSVARATRDYQDLIQNTPMDPAKKWLDMNKTAKFNLGEAIRAAKEAFKTTTKFDEPMDYLGGQFFCTTIPYCESE